MTVSKQIIDQILDLRSQRDDRNNPTYTYTEIGERVGLNERQVKHIYYQNRPARIGTVDIREKAVPVLTLGGTIWHWPPYIGDYGKGWSRSCNEKRCKFYARCKEAVSRGDYVACEIPLERELIHEKE